MPLREVPTKKLIINLEFSKEMWIHFAWHIVVQSNLCTLVLLNQAVSFDPKVNMKLYLTKGVQLWRCQSLSIKEDVRLMKESPVLLVQRSVVKQTDSKSGFTAAMMSQT